MLTAFAYTSLGDSAVNSKVTQPPGVLLEGEEESLSEDDASYNNEESLSEDDASGSEGEESCWASTVTGPASPPAATRTSRG